MSLKEKLEAALKQLQDAWAFSDEQIDDIRVKMSTYARDTTLEFTIDMFKR